MIWGLLLVTLAGFGTGTIAWPIKLIRNFHFELFLFAFMFTGIILIPWLVMLFGVAQPWQLIKDIGFTPLLVSNLFSISWGIANVIYLICVVRIGAALTGAILSALGMCVGVLLPMIIKGSGLFQQAPDIFSNAGITVIAGLVVLIIGVVLVSIAGFQREKRLKSEDASVRRRQASGNFLQGLLLVIMAGLLSSGISLAFVYSQDTIMQAVVLQSGNDVIANFSVWALGMFGGGLVNTGYAVYLMFKNNTGSTFFKRKQELVYGGVIGLQFILSIVALGKGMVLLGVLGASVGFAIQQSMQIIGNQVVGFVGGEWRGIGGKPLITMYVSLAVILMAVTILAVSRNMV